MVVRATLQQSIDALKTHQSRREHQYVLRQLHELRALIKNQDEPKSNHAEVRSIKAVISEHQERLDKFMVDLEATRQDQRTVVARLEFTKQTFSDGKAENAACIDQLQRVVSELSSNLQQTLNEQIQLLAEHTDRLGALEARLLQDGGPGGVACIQEGLGTTESIPLLGTQQVQAGSKVLVRRSHEPVNAATCGQDDIPELSKCLQGVYASMSATVDSPPDDLDVIPETSIDARSPSASPPVIELSSDNVTSQEDTEINIHTSMTASQDHQYGVRSWLTGTQSVDNSFHNLTRRFVTLQDLKQSDAETFATYAERCRQLFAQEVVLSEDIVVQHMVNELKDPRIRSAATSWLDATGWTIDELARFQPTSSTVHGGSELRTNSKPTSYIGLDEANIRNNVHPVSWHATQASVSRDALSDHQASLNEQRSVSAFSRILTTINLDPLMVPLSGEFQHLPTCRRTQSVSRQTAYHNTISNPQNRTSRCSGSFLPPPVETRRPPGTPNTYRFHNSIYDNKTVSQPLSLVFSISPRTNSRQKIDWSLAESVARFHDAVQEDQSSMLHHTRRRLFSIFRQPLLRDIPSPRVLKRKRPASAHFGNLTSTSEAVIMPKDLSTPTKSAKRHKRLSTVQNSDPIARSKKSVSLVSIPEQSMRPALPIVSDEDGDRFDRWHSPRD